MTNEETLSTLKEYFRKLQKILNIEADFEFLGYKIIKKSKIDDILCCIIATLPDSYKKLMKTKEGQQRSSVLSYNLLFKAIKQKFILNSNTYLVSYDSAIRYINSLIRDLQRDIEFAEKNIH